ncbi:glutathione s-transferase [Nannochloropsis oceanica]
MALRGGSVLALVTIFLSVTPALGFLAPSATLSTFRCTSSKSGSTSRSHRRSSSRTTMAAGKDATLYDFPVSNNGGRCRVVIYDKGIQDKIEIKKPDGALTEINPQGKVPVLIDHSLNEFQIFESDTILRHLVGKYEGTGPSYLPSSLAARTKSDLICRFHDMYITTIQGCMYKASPPFGVFDNREDALIELKKQMKLLEGMVDGEGPFLCGKEKSMADATLFCTGVFLEQILPNHFGWTYQEVFGPLLTKWWENLLATESAFQKVHSEIILGIQGWEEKRRWMTILGADFQDLAPATIFDRIIKKEVPSDVVYENDKVLAFRDIAPQAPTHILVIPKRRQGLTSLRKATEEQKGVLGEMMLAVAKIVRQEGIEGGYRLVVNDGEEAGQTVNHLHIHILAGRPLKWPPG